jgi:hypothetical protein
MRSPEANSVSLMHFVRQFNPRNGLVKAKSQLATVCHFREFFFYFGKSKKLRGPSLVNKVLVCNGFLSQELASSKCIMNLGNVWVENPLVTPEFRPFPPKRFPLPSPAINIRLSLRSECTMVRTQSTFVSVLRVVGCPLLVSSCKSPRLS